LLYKRPFALHYALYFVQYNELDTDIMTVRYFDLQYMNDVSRINGVERNQPDYLLCCANSVFVQHNSRIKNMSSTKIISHSCPVCVIIHWQQAFGTYFISSGAQRLGRHDGKQTVVVQYSDQI